MSTPRHLRMTEADKLRKIRRQQSRRKDSRSLGKIREALQGRSYDDLYQEIFQSQQGLCAICSKDLSLGHRPHMDHCHEDLIIRGILCFSCNSKLGFVEKYLAQIVEYLTKEKHW